MHSDSTVEADTNSELMPGMLKQPNLTLELFPNHSESMESAKKVKFGFCEYMWSLMFDVMLDQTELYLFYPAESFSEGKEVIDWKILPPTGA